MMKLGDVHAGAYFKAQASANSAKPLVAAGGVRRYSDASSDWRRISSFAISSCSLVDRSSSLVVSSSSLVD